MAIHHKHVTPCLSDYPFLLMGLDPHLKGTFPYYWEREVSPAIGFLASMVPGDIHLDFHGRQIGRGQQPSQLPFSVL